MCRPGPGKPDALAVPEGWPEWPREAGRNCPEVDWPEAPEGLSEMAPEGLVAGIKSPPGVGGSRRVLPQKGASIRRKARPAQKMYFSIHARRGSPYANSVKHGNMDFSILKFRDPPCVGVVV